MTYRWIEHTAELALEIEAPSEEDVFRDALAALGELVAGENGGKPTRHAFAVDGTGRDELLVAFLEELIFLAETEQFVPERPEELVFEDGSLHAVVTGRRGSPRPLVKAVTYHDLEFAHRGDGWYAHVVLDV